MDNLSHAIISYNHTWHSEIDQSPSQCILTHVCKDAPNLWTANTVKETWKEGHPKFAPFRVGELVWKKVQLLGNLASNNMSEHYEGPFKIRKIYSNGLTYILCDDAGVEWRALYTQLRLP